MSSEDKPDSHSALKAVDLGEAVAQIEPTTIGESSRHRAELLDLVVELVAKSASFRGSLPPGVAAAVAGLVRSMNCYYSNLIEGHATHPIDIERALADDYSDNPEQRDLQLEARAHIVVQEWIDGGGLVGRAVSGQGLREIHRRFCEPLPADLLWVDNPETGERLEVVPGQLRSRDVKVGRHVPVSPGAVPRFLGRFESAYAHLGVTDSILAAAAAHHRLLWIHPFLDGNGRVARLMSHAMLLDALDTGGVWSIARGLARNVAAYKGGLMACDAPRRNDLDGRGALSEEALAEFTRFFLRTCIDQVDFMARLMQPERLAARVTMWAEEEMRVGGLPPTSDAVLAALLRRGQLKRGDVPALLGVGPRQARRITSALSDAGALTSSSSRAPLRIAMPAKLAARWFPGLFPDLP